MGMPVFNTRGRDEPIAKWLQETRDIVLWYGTGWLQSLFRYLERSKRESRV